MAVCSQALKVRGAPQVAAVLRPHKVHADALRGRAEEGPEGRLLKRGIHLADALHIEAPLQQPARTKAHTIPCSSTPAILACDALTLLKHLHS